MRLVAVVLNWNGGDDTLAALASLAGIETICVDNGSTDGSAELVEARHPEVELVRAGANLGFAGGNNVGIRRALERGADWVLLLNNDATAEPGLAEALERAAHERPDAGLLACTILVGDGATIQYAGASFNARLGYSGRVETARARRAARRRPCRRRRSRRLARRARACGPARRDALPLRRGRRMVAAHPRGGLRGRLRARCARAARGLRIDAAAPPRRRTSTTTRATRSSSASGLRHFRRGLRDLRRGVIVGAHLVQSLSHPKRTAAARAVLAGWRDARAGKLGQRSSA